MTEFKETFNTREFDPRIMIRACMFYLREFDLHIRNVEHLHTNTIKFYADRLLESILTIEDYANMIYQDIPEDEKSTLEMKEKKRNEELYNSGMVYDKGIEQVNDLIKAQAERYGKIRSEVKDQLKND